jgi:hypothetical protein
MLLFPQGLFLPPRWLIGMPELFPQLILLLREPVPLMLLLPQGLFLPPRWLIDMPELFPQLILLLQKPTP